MKATVEMPSRQDSSVPWNNVDELTKTIYQLHTQTLFAVKCIRAGVPARELLVSRFPYHHADWSKPPSMHIELTNACNLRCIYCHNPFFPHPRKMMSCKTLQNLIEPLRRSRISRVCVGGGEATLHPEFAEFVSHIRQAAKIMTTVTNGQWENPEFGEALVSARFDLIEVSIDVGGPSIYERSRPGASFQRLLTNIMALWAAKQRLHSSSQINIRLMVRPSQHAAWKHEKRFWKQYCDTMYAMHIVQLDDVPPQRDIYVSPYGRLGTCPRCTLPFRNIQVRANGDVPLCQIAGSNPSRRLIIGNVNETPLLELWNSAVMKQYRIAHRMNDAINMPICKGCVGV